jgi:hypothetical protein
MVFTAYRRQNAFLLLSEHIQEPKAVYAKLVKAQTRLRKDLAKKEQLQLAADGKKEIFFSVDTNVLESTFKDYVSIDTTEIDNIDELWKGIADSNPIFNRLRLNNFMDTPLKFLLTLKTIYNRDGDYARGHFIGNQQTLTREHLDTHLGELTQRIQKHLVGNGTIKANKGETKVKEIKHLLLETIFAIAKERRWLLTDPRYEDGRYTFNLNAGYFDRRAIARRLKDDGQRAGKNPS